MKKNLLLLTLCMQAYLFIGCDTLPLANLPGMTQPPLPVTNPDLLGTWKGTVDQPGFGSYPVTMNITERVGSIDYPTLSCGGSLRLIETRGAVYIFKEKIEYGRGNCTDAGMINVEIRDKNSLDWSWSHHSVTQALHATLVKSDIRRATPAPTEGRAKETAPFSSEAASFPIIETESYRMVINSVKKSGNTVSTVLTFENLTRKDLHLSMCDAHLIDEIGEKWTQLQIDTASIFVCGTTMTLSPETKRKTTLLFVAEESGDGTVFTFDMGEWSPVGRKHILRNIRVEQKSKEASPPPEPTSTSVLETESYRMTIDSVKKSENALKMDLTFENLTSKILPLSLTRDPGFTHLLDDIGEKWTLQQADTAGIFVDNVGIQLAPGAKRKTTVTFVTEESGKGTLFTFVFWEGQPQQGRTHTLHRIKAEPK